MTFDIAVYGCGGFGREVAWLVDSLEENYRVVCFIDDNPEHSGRLVNKIPVLGLTEAYSSYPEAKVIGSIGNPQIRAKIMEKAFLAGFRFESVIHPDVKMSKWVDLGHGIVICAGSIITTNIVLGDHVQINLDCTIGHDAVLEEYVTLAPGVHVSGHVHIGKRTYIGTGATIINGTKENPLVIGSDTVIGAGACVINNIPSDSTFVGVPAKQVK